MRVRDVFSGHPPTIGLGGRIFGINNTQGAHPGPLSFYLLAPVYRLFGSTSWALQMSGAVLNVVAAGHHAVGDAPAVGPARRAAGGGRARRSSSSCTARTLLVYPWNPFMPVLFWVLFLVCVWGVLCGDLPLLPVAVLAGLALRPDPHPLRGARRRARAGGGRVARPAAPAGRPAATSAGASGAGPVRARGWARSCGCPSWSSSWAATRATSRSSGTGSSTSTIRPSATARGGGWCCVASTSRTSSASRAPGRRGSVPSCWRRGSWRPSWPCAARSAT